MEKGEGSGSSLVQMGGSGSYAFEEVVMLVTENENVQSRLPHYNSLTYIYAKSRFLGTTQRYAVLEPQNIAKIEHIF